MYSLHRVQACGGCLREERVAQRLAPRALDGLHAQHVEGLLVARAGTHTLYAVTQTHTHSVCGYTQTHTLCAVTYTHTHTADAVTSCGGGLESHKFKTFWSHGQVGFIHTHTLLQHIAVTSYKGC